MLESPLISLPILDSVPVAPALPRRLETLRVRLLELDPDQAVARFDLRNFDRLLKSTISLCAECLEHVPAIVYSRGGRVLMRKQCPRHGAADAVVENDERFYFLSNKDRWGRCYADDRLLAFPAYESGCGGASACCGGSASQRGGIGFEPAAAFTDQLSNKTCTVLVEITNACNLSCKVCYSDAKGDRVIPFDLLRQYLLRLIEQKGELDSVQLTGGEAILHPQFWEIVAFLHQQPGVRKIYLPTNGILFAREEHARRLVPFRDKLMVLLQFDGHSADANWNLRNANPTALRQRVIENLGRDNIVMQLTMTLTRGVNDQEVGWVIDTARRHSHIKLVALQPVTYSGRYELARESLDRLTLSDVVKAVVSQARTRMQTDDFVPIPCSHPNCGWLTLFVRRWGWNINIARHIDLAAVMNRVAYKTVLSAGEVRSLVGTSRLSLASRLIGAIGRKLVRPTDLFGIAIKPFMDCFNYDQDRISNCCHHLLTTQGTPVSFCEYNAILRQTDSWIEFPVLRDA